MPPVVMRFFESGKATRDSMPGEDGSDAERNELERKHTELIHKALQRIMRVVVPTRTTTENITPDLAVQRYRDNQHVLRDALVAMLTDGALLGAEVGQRQNDWRMGVGKSAIIGGVDWDLINADVLAWVTGGGAMGGGFGEGYANAVTAAMATTSERQLRTLIGEWINNSLTYRQLVDDVSRTVGSRQRAEMVATTEITRAYAEGNRAAWRRGGVIQQMRWYTANDERTCPICGAAHGQISDVNGDFSNGLFPPAHPRCRCSVHPYIGDTQASTTTTPEPTVSPAPVAVETTAEQALQRLAEVEQRFADRIRAAEELRARYETSSSEIGRLTRRQDEILVEYANATPERKKELNKESRAIRKELKSLRELRNTYVNDIGPAYEARAKAARELVYVSDPGDNAIVFKERLRPVSEQARRSAEEGMAEFNKLVSRSFMSGNNVQFEMMKPGYRANYDDYFNEFYGPPDVPVWTSVHEIAHSIEYKVPGVSEKVRAWRDRRTAGEEWQKLSDLTGSDFYRDNEVAKRDRFIHPYIGKQYGGKSSEVVSMGIQFMHEDAVKFAKDDPDMFGFIFDLVRGRDVSRYGVR